MLPFILNMRDVDERPPHHAIPFGIGHNTQWAYLDMTAAIAIFTYFHKANIHGAFTAASLKLESMSRFRIIHLTFQIIVIHVNMIVEGIFGFARAFANLTPVCPITGIQFAIEFLLAWGAVDMNRDFNFLMGGQR